MPKPIKVTFVLVLTLAVIGISIFLIKWGVDEVLKIVCPIKYEQIVSKASEEYGVSKELIYAVINIESGFAEKDVSKAGAKGLMQMTDDTFEWLQTKRGLKNKMQVYSLFSPEISIDYGTYFLALLMDKYENEQTALAAYNAGMGNVDKWLLDKSHSSDGKTLDYIPFKETEKYVSKVAKCKEIYIYLYAKEEA